MSQNLNKVGVSVCMITYNHESFIRDAIEGVLMQETASPLELIIGEDCSTDNTRKICEEYADKCTNIRLLPSVINLGMIDNFIRTLEACANKYIAICEGDDYWIDPLKLQKQVDILEANPEYSLCFHDAIVLWDDKLIPPKFFCPIDQKQTSTIGDVIEKYFIPTASMVFRREVIMPLPKWFSNIYNGDYALDLLLAAKGNIYYMNEIMSVYRKHLDGSMTSRNDSVKNTRNLIKLFHYFNSTFPEFTQKINLRIKSLTNQLRFNKLVQRYYIIRIINKIYIKLEKCFGIRK